MSKLTISLVAIVFVFTTGTLQAQPVHNTDTGEPFNTIKSAIDDPDTQNGHTIQVSPGTYNERINFNDKDITVASNFLISNDTNDITATIIDGDLGDYNPDSGQTETYSVVTIARGEGVNNPASLIGFTITG